MNYREKLDTNLVFAKAGYKLDNKYLQKLRNSSIEYFYMSLAVPGVESEISRYLASVYNHNTNIYDTIIDQNYLQTHVGGSALHHNLDGSHTWDGAMSALQEAFPNEPSITLASHSFIHLMNDFTTPSGINPFLSPEQFMSAKNFLVELGFLDSRTVNDLLNSNVAELLTAAVAACAIILDFKDEELKTYSTYSTRLALTSIVSGNPIMLVMSTILLAGALSIVWRSGSYEAFIKHSIDSGFSAASFLYVSSHLPAPIFLSLAVATVASITIKGIVGNVCDLSNKELDHTFAQLFTSYRSYLGAIE